MLLSRRKFLGWATALAGLGGCDAKTSAIRSPEEREKLRAAASMEPPEAEPVELSNETIAALRKLTEVYTGVPYEPDVVSITNHYDEYFRWWARERPRHGKAYQRHTSALERIAQEVKGKSFVDCDAATCLELIDQAIPEGMARRSFENTIQRAIIKFYLRTDAWLDMGYASWRGQPRGLEAYRRPPVKMP